jgi:hypothetical protein
MVCLIYTNSKGIFSYLDFRGVLIRVISSSYRVTSTLIIKPTSYTEPMLIEEVVKIIVAIVVKMV